MIEEIALWPSFRQHAGAAGPVQHHLEVGLDDPAFLRIRDAYLDVFSDLAPQTELVEALELACHVRKAARALT